MYRESCLTIKTSQWRKGNIEKPILCNACGVYYYRYKKNKIINININKNLEKYALILLSFKK